MNYNKNDVIMAMNNQKDAFERIYKSIYMDLYKMSYYLLGNGEQAKDVVSEAVLDAYVGIAKLKDSDKFEQWMLKILVTKCKRKLREKYEKISVFNPKVSNIDEYQPVETGDSTDNEARTDVQIAMSRLKRDERTIISLCVVEGYKSHEVAEILGMNASTVRSKLNRGLEKMKKYLEVK